MYPESQVCKPVILEIAENEEDRLYLQSLRARGDVVEIFDTIAAQLNELVKIRNPSKKLSADECSLLSQQILCGSTVEDYGVWVYYPWSRRLVHLLGAAEFAEVRTNRNKYKITAREQLQLASKRVGVVGLSVGQSVALTLAMERSFGELRLADFDTLDLSNLNRIRSGVHEMGVLKVVNVAREIAEIDPFLDVRIFPEGLTEANMDAFFHDGGDLDLLIEECDNLEMKIKSRLKAKAHRIPVLMDTSDRGLVDIERFDMEPERPILHGLAEGLENKALADLSVDEKIPFLMRLVGSDTLSMRMRASVLEVEQSIASWPQLASSVVQGGGIIAELSRRILLREPLMSGRYYFDLDGVLRRSNDGEGAADKNSNVDKSRATLSQEEISAMTRSNADIKAHQGRVPLTFEDVDQLLNAARHAPSGGNNQPWRWVVSDGIFYLFHDHQRSESWVDVAHFGAYLALGAAVESIRLEGIKLNLQANIRLLEPDRYPQLVATISFKPNVTEPAEADRVLSSGLSYRHTDRRFVDAGNIEPKIWNDVRQVAGDAVQMHILSARADIDELGDLIAACDRVRLLDAQGHKEFFEEIRLTQDEAERTGDGLDIVSANLSPSELAALGLARSSEVISFLSDEKLGHGFGRLSRRQVRGASGFALFTARDERAIGLMEAGRAINRAWIQLNLSGKAVHPMLSPVIIVRKLLHTPSPQFLAQLGPVKSVRQRLQALFNLDENAVPAFLMKVGEQPIAYTAKSFRRSLDQFVLRQND